MSIRYIEDTRQLILETKNTAYQMKIDELGYPWRRSIPPSA